MLVVGRPHSVTGDSPTVVARRDEPTSRPVGRTQLRGLPAAPPTMSDRNPAVGHGTASERVRATSPATLPGSTVLRERRLDLLLIGAVPVVLLVAFLLPAELKWRLAFRYTEPSVVTAYAAHVVHFEPAHLATNLVGYVLLVGCCYLLAVGAGRRRFFLFAFGAVLVAVPPVLAASNLAVPRDGVTYGFSGLNMALLGLLPILLVEFARVRFWSGFDRRDVAVPFGASLATIAVLSVPGSVTTALLSSVALAVAAASVRDLLARGFRPRRFLGLVLERRRDGNRLALGGVLFVGYLFVGFPSTVVVDGTVLNLYVHFVGYVLGFAGAGVLLWAGGRRSRTGRRPTDSRIELPSP